MDRTCASWHHCHHAVRGTLLFRDWIEARALWERVTALPGLQAAALMPDHLHLLLPARDPRAVAGCLASFTRWRNGHRRTSGPTWTYGELPTAVSDGAHLRRTRRYIHLNPCRKGLVADPLAWPFSTHRDCVGLAIPPACRRVHDPDGFHAYVSGDPDARPQGTFLPVAPRLPEPPLLDEIRFAVSALTRTPLDQVATARPAAILFRAAVRALRPERDAALARLLGVHRSAICRLPQPDPSDVRRVARVLGDPRFGPLDPGDLRALPGWGPYRGRR